MTLEEFIDSLSKEEQNFILKIMSERDELQKKFNTIKELWLTKPTHWVEKMYEVIKK